MDLIEFLQKKEQVPYLWIDSISYLPYLKEIYPSWTFVEDSYVEPFLIEEERIPVFLKDYKNLPKRGIFTQKKKPENILEIKLPFQLKPFLKKFFDYYKVHLDEEALESLLLLEKNFDFYHEFLQRALLTEEKKVLQEHSFNVFHLIELFFKKEFNKLPELELKELRFFQQHFFKTFSSDIGKSFYDRLIEKTKNFFSPEERKFFLNLFTDLEIFKKNQQPIKIVLLWNIRKFYAERSFE